MSVDPEVVDYVAGLAKLRLDDEERERIADQLDRIVRYVEKLGELDLEEVPPTVSVAESSDVDRADEPRDSLSREEALSNASDSEEGHFVVPRVVPE